MSLLSCAASRAFSPQLLQYSLIFSQTRLSHHKGRARTGCSVDVAISGLGKLLVNNHLLLELYENLLHGVLLPPLLEDVELGGLNLAVLLVHTGQVGLGQEVHLRSLSGVVGAALDGQEVDAVVEVGIDWPDDGSIPLSEGGVLT